MKDLQALFDTIVSAEDCSDTQLESLKNLAGRMGYDLWSHPIKFEQVLDYHQRWLVKNGRPPIEWPLRNETFLPKTHLRDHEKIFYNSGCWFAEKESDLYFWHVGNIYITNYSVLLEWGIFFKGSRLISLDNVLHCTWKYYIVRGKPMKGLSIIENGGRESILYGFDEHPDDARVQRDCAVGADIVHYLKGHPHREEPRSDQSYQKRHNGPMENEEVFYGKILGLEGEITRDDINAAYRKQASLYHPDKVSHLGEDLQKLASKKMKEINKAAEYFRRKYGP